MIRPANTCRPLVESDLQELIELANERVKRGLAPPAELYRVQNRARIDWSAFPGWARPIDPDVFEGCCHEG